MEAILALPPFLLDAMAFGDVPEDEDDALDPAMQVPDRGGVVLDGSRRPVPADEHDFIA